jgi:hypothetical protein
MSMTFAQSVAVDALNPGPITGRGITSAVASPALPLRVTASAQPRIDPDASASSNVRVRTSHAVPLGGDRAVPRGTAFYDMSIPLRANGQGRYDVAHWVTPSGQDITLTGDLTGSNFRPIDHTTHVSARHNLPVTRLPEGTVRILSAGLPGGAPNRRLGITGDGRVVRLDGNRLVRRSTNSQAPTPVPGSNRGTATNSNDETPTLRGQALSTGSESVPPATSSSPTRPRGRRLGITAQGEIVRMEGHRIVGRARNLQGRGRPIPVTSFDQAPQLHEQLLNSGNAAAQAFGRRLQNLHHDLSAGLITQDQATERQYELLELVDQGLAAPETSPAHLDEGAQLIIGAELLILSRYDSNATVQQQFSEDATQYYAAALERARPLPDPWRRWDSQVPVEATYVVARVVRGLLDAPRWTHQMPADQTLSTVFEEAGASRLAPNIRDSLLQQMREWRARGRDRLFLEGALENIDDNVAGMVAVHQIRHRITQDGLGVNEAIQEVIHNFITSGHEIDFDLENRIRDHVEASNLGASNE